MFQRDILALLSHPAKRLADVKLTNRGYEEWTYGYVDTDKNVLGLKIDWPTLTATFPPGNDALRDQVTNFVLYRPYPQTGRYRAFRRKWFGRLVDRYRGTPTKVVFVRLPRGPIPRPDNLVQNSSNNVRRNRLGLHLAQKQLIVLVAGLCQVLRPARFRVVDESVHISIKTHREVSQRHLQYLQIYISYFMQREIIIG